MAVAAAAAVAESSSSIIGDIDELLVSNIFVCLSMKLDVDGKLLAGVIEEEAVVVDASMSKVLARRLARKNSSLDSFVNFFQLSSSCLILFSNLF